MQRWARYIAVSAVIGFLTAVAGAEEYSIPPDKVDDQKIFSGSAERFSKPGAVDYKAVVRATPEYNTIVEKKIESGTAKYWILISRASEHAVRVIREVGRESDYDLIVVEGYLASLEPPIEADNVTDLVLKKLSEEE